MRIVIRTDASLHLGSGHVMRCLTLADSLREKGADISFVCADLKGNLCDLIEGKGYKVHKLLTISSSLADKAHQIPWAADAEHTKAVLRNEHNMDWLIVDNYALDHLWETPMRSLARKIMVIDDLADRRHDCDLLLDQNFYEDMERRYDNIVPGHCRKLIGPKYALLRKEFEDTRKSLRSRNGSIKRILVFFGGSDMTNETSKALKALRLLNRPDMAADVVIGVNNPFRREIETAASAMSRVACYFQIANMAELMDSSDLYIGAAGTTTWERCCMGLPSLVMPVAENQVRATEDMARHKLLHYIGVSANVSSEDVKDALDYFLMNPEVLKEYSSNSLKLVDGLGADRCANIMVDLLK